MALSADKREVQKQWDQDPCGAVTAKDRPIGTLDFYRAVRNHRYNDYAPWFDDIVRFDEWKHKDVLEVGVGLGSDHFRFARNRNRMFALDLSREHLTHTHRHLKLERLTTRPIYGDAESMPIRDNTFDLVYSFGVLHHTPNTQAAVTEVHRVLKPCGTAIIGLYHRNSYFFWGTTMLFNGVLRGGLWRKGWRRLLSEIEFREDPNSALPLVKVYSRRQAKWLFNQFSRVEIIASHVHPVSFQRFAPFSRAFLERFFGWFGWYLVIKARK